MLDSSEKFDSAKSVLEEKDFKDFIKIREISPEDFRIIEELSRFDKDFFIHFHNFFSVNNSKEKQIKELESQIEFLKKDVAKAEAGWVKDELKKRIPFQELLLEFLKKYNPGAGMHLVAIFERRKK